MADPTQPQIQAPASTGLPTANFPKQAIIVIHGMGEQMPMDTIKGFVRAAWETTTDLADKELPFPTEVWSKPDVRTGSLELRRITTRQSIQTDSFPKGVRSDFYELYWADLSAGSTWSQVKDWIGGLLLRNPFTAVPSDVRLAWFVLWIITLVVAWLALAAALPDPAKETAANAVAINLWDYPPMSWLRGFRGWQLTLATGVIGWIGTSFIVPYFGRVVRYTRAKPDNIAARKNIRDRGMSLLAELHNREYERIIVVGHSLGSILAYDLIGYFWANHPDARVMAEADPEYKALRAIEAVLADKAFEKVPADKAMPNADTLKAFLETQTRLGHLLRCRPKPVGNDPDRRWLITDLVTLGSPLSHAEFLMVKDAYDLNARRKNREYPTSPPQRELLDPDAKKQAVAAGFPSDVTKLLAFPFDTKLGTKHWQLHHAAAFAVVRWTNIYDPACLVAFGDLISGPVAPVFGQGVIDVNLKQCREDKGLKGQSWHFTHTEYWKLPKTNQEQDPADDTSVGETKPITLAPVPEHIKQLRLALDLGGEHRRV